MIQYVYEKYGRERAALAATVITYRPRSAVRDVGKALGLPLDRVDRLAKSHAWWDDWEDLRTSACASSGFDPDSAVVRATVRARHTSCSSFPRHLSQHVGGFVISRRSRSASWCRSRTRRCRTAPVIQWDKDDLEALGMLKVDVPRARHADAIRNDAST